MPEEANQLTTAIDLNATPDSEDLLSIGASKLPIASSESFEMEDVARFLAAESATIVTLLGERASGKSTLLCSIYDRYLHGPFAGRRTFAARTITGLERRAHLERIASGRETPDTERTSLAEGLRYFHFGTSSIHDIHDRQHLLISDRAGERYKDARGNPDLASNLAEFDLADTLVVLVDGARVANAGTRGNAFFVAQQTLQMLIDSGAAKRDTPIQVVFTKRDLLDEGDTAPELRLKLEAFKEHILTTFSEQFMSIHFFEIAARAKRGDYAAAFGVDDLMNSWLQGRKKSRTPITVAAVVPQSEFEKLADRCTVVEES